MHSFYLIAVASALTSTASALPRFPFAGLFERAPQYEAASSFPTLNLASATGVVPTGILTGSGTIVPFPTGTGTGSPFFPNTTITGGTGALPGPTGYPISEPLSSFSIAASVDVGPIKAPLSCPVVTAATVTETVTETITKGGAPFPSGTGGTIGTVGTVILPTATPYAL